MPVVCGRIGCDIPLTEKSFGRSTSQNCSPVCLTFRCAAERITPSQTIFSMFLAIAAARAVIDSPHARAGVPTDIFDD
jgi:hypothetical protein